MLAPLEGKILEGSGMPKLVDCTNGQVLGEFPVNKDRMVIGSKASNEIPLDNVNADNEHAVIIRCGDLYVIEDLGSANGTFVHDRKITKLLLSDEDLISVGNCQLRFVEEDVKRGDAGPSAEQGQGAGGGRRQTATGAAGQTTCGTGGRRRRTGGRRMPALRLQAASQGRQGAGRQVPVLQDGLCHHAGRPDERRVENRRPPRGL
jgi:hypothetical protein